MRVLHITTIDTGGAYKAAYRLHENMLLYGIDSRILVRTKLKAEGPATEAFDNLAQKIISKGKNGVNRIFSKGIIMNDRFGTDLSGNRLVQSADVILLHWINSFLTCESIVKLGRMGKPIIWVMHDMWLFTGGCHVDGYCGRYSERCGRCPLIGGRKIRDLSSKIFLEKLNMIQQLDVTVTGPSHWIIEQAHKSDILAGKKIYYMPNVLDTSLYRPLNDKEKQQGSYGVNTNKKIILFGAADDGTANVNKGFHYLREAFSYLKVEVYLLLIFGNTEEDLGLPAGLEVVQAGYVSEENKLVELYNLADVFVNPSSQESFGYTVCEAMACGTPAVGFPIGGIKEQITHRVNGYLAEYHDVKDLARGIEFCVDNTEKLGEAACRSAQNYSYTQRWFQKIIQ